MLNNKSVRYFVVTILVFVILTLFVSGPVFAFSNFNFDARNNTTFIEPFSKNPPAWITGEDSEPWWENIFDKKTGFDNWGGSSGSAGNKWW
jgi:hypothetical protein